MVYGARDNELPDNQTFENSTYVPDLGCFVAIIGPSGAGKDTLLALVQESFKNDPRFVFAKRVVTRQAQGEDHDTLSIEGFLHAQNNGAFCLNWQAHGLYYGLPQQLIDDLTQGKTVIANISRKTLNQCADKFKNFAIIEITAQRDILRQRLKNRGRESDQDIEQRLLRASLPFALPRNIMAYQIDNSFAPQHGAEQLQKLLCLLQTTSEP